MTQIGHLDDSSILILKNVLDFGLRSTRKIGKDLGVSHQTVHSKLEKLQKEGLIQGFFAHLDYKKLGFVSEEVLVKLRSLDQKKFEKAVDVISARPEVAKLVSLKGEYDLLVRIRTRDLDSLNHAERSLRDELKDKLDVEKWDVNLIVEDLKTRPTSRLLGVLDEKKKGLERFSKFQILGRR